MMFQAESDQMIKLSATLNMSVWSVIWAVCYCAATAGNQRLGITLPVVAFATTDMDNDTAYALTKTYWENKGALGAAAQWWNGVSMDMLSNILTEIHPGAIRYYKEAGATLAQHH